MEKMKIVLSLMLALLLISTLAQATPITYGFQNIPNSVNNTDNAAIGEAQIFMDFTDPATGQVLFTFRNNGPYASSICQIYDVSFHSRASPPDFPGGNNISPPFVTTKGFLAGADSAGDDVNPREFAGILFSLNGGRALPNAINDLESRNLCIDIYILHIGIYTQSFHDRNSEVFLNNVSPTPEPGTFLFLSSGLLSLVGYRKLRLHRIKK
jgi:hypothetical protein